MSVFQKTEVIGRFHGKWESYNIIYTYQCHGYFYYIFNWLSLPTEAVVRESKKEEKIIERMDLKLPNIGNQLVPKF